MSLSPEIERAPDLQRPSRLRKIKAAASKAVEAYSARPFHTAFHLTLLGTILFLFAGIVPKWQTWAVLAALGAVEFHAWYVKEGYLSPLFSRFFRPPRKKK